jgi:hypothetical protein
MTHDLRGIDFPARKDQMVQHARQNQAADDTNQAIQMLPDREYQSMADVMQGFGQMRRK